MSERRTYTIPNLEFDDFMFSMTYTKITVTSNRTFSVDFDNIWTLLKGYILGTRSCFRY